MLRSLRHFQQAWTRLKPKRCRFIEIVPASFADAPPADDRAIAAFSGGIDSTFLALQHTSDDLGPARYPLTDLMFVHGLDIPLEQSEAFAKAMERSREFVESTSLRLRTVRTNVRKLEYTELGGCSWCCYRRLAAPVQPRIQPWNDRQYQYLREPAA
jgi:tRNA(Ile)-lysidine synthase TilS/MesJ